MSGVGGCGRLRFDDAHGVCSWPLGLSIFAGNQGVAVEDTGFRVGAQFGPYVLKRLIGAGGMGSVYEARDTALDRVVALKLISGKYAQDPAYRQRLQREARIAGRLQDPHVVPIHSAGEIDGQLYVDMRLINGIDLDSLLRQTGPLPPARAVNIVRQVASALDAAHEVGVLHRDVKPGNILITSDDFAYLVDFGIANAASEQALTQMGDVLGTWAYMSPERFSGTGDNVTASADTYALACVLFEAITGTQPFTGDRASLIGAHLSAPVPRVSAKVGLAPALDEVIARGMAKNPDDRYPTSGEFARAASAAAVVAATADFAAPTVVHSAAPIAVGAPQTMPAGPMPPVATTPAPFASSQPPQPGSWPPASQPPPYGGSQPPPYPGSPYPGSQPPGPATAPGYPPPPPPGSQPPWGQQPGSPEPEKPGNRIAWIAAAAAVVLVLALGAGFGAWYFTRDEPGTSKADAVDLSTLDTGRFDTEPHPLPSTGDEAEGRIVAATDLAEGIANPYEIDDSLGFLYGYPVPDPALAATAISGTSTPVVQPVLEKYGMTSAYIVQGFSKKLTDFLKDGNGDSLIIMLTSFANPDLASRAAADMDATDAAVNPANNSVKIPGHPDAHAHYATGNASIAATVARGYVVASIMTFNRSATTLDAMTNWVAKVLDAQTPLMDDLLPTAEAALTSLPLDPDDMLRRIFVADGVPPLSDTFNSIGPRAAILCAPVDALEKGVFEDAGVDRCAMAPAAYLLRTRDEAAAADLMPKMVEADREASIEQDIDPPAGLDSAKCNEQKEEVWADNANVRYQCWLTFAHYVALVAGPQVKDVHQRASAQYAILVNSQ